jgi:hypothetical protein
MLQIRRLMSHISLHWLIIKEKPVVVVLLQPCVLLWMPLAAAQFLLFIRKSHSFSIKQRLRMQILPGRSSKRMDSPLLIFHGELLALSPNVRKLFVDGCKVNCIPIFSATYQVAKPAGTASSLLAQATPLHSMPIMELYVQIQGKFTEIGLYDPSSELACISEVAAKDMVLPFSTDLQLNMHNANGGV